MQSNITACPICAATTNTGLCLADGYTIWRCSQCATDFVWPMPDNQTLRDLYDREMWFEGGEKGGYQGYDAQTEHSLSLFDKILNDFGQNQSGSNILDIGCGYGTHLSLAAERGWRCFGVELSGYARQIAKQRHGNSLVIVENVDDLLPCEFDLILFFDVLEHVKDPYELFFKLFGKGAITPRTKLVITTPNARSAEAVLKPGEWTYRHPPSHLVYYSAESLRFLLTRLHFADVTIVGTHPTSTTAQASYENEYSSLNDDLMRYEGLLCKAQGSDFKSFMHERYVPGTWSKITEYEHLPRYIFANTLSLGKKVLDFGCGTGYGSALLAEGAETVLGVDIDEAALQWAKQTHRGQKLNFQRRSDLGKGLPEHSFDIIACFEMIEHVDEMTQRDIVSNFSRLLIPSGKLIISTPNPKVTVNYGENPFHLHEMDETEFERLLRSCFKYVTILKQWLRPSVVVDARPSPQTSPNFVDRTFGSHKDQSNVLPAAFIAVCSNEPIPEIQGICYFDSSCDYIGQTIATEKMLNNLRFENYKLIAYSSLLKKLQTEIEAKKQELAEKNQRLAGKNEEPAEQGGLLPEKEQNIEEFRDALAEKEKNIRQLQGEVISKNFELRKKQGELSSLLALHQKQCRTPWRSFLGEHRHALHSAMKRIKGRLLPSRKTLAVIKPYQVRQLHPSRGKRFRVMHAIANFMIGGSSRLVVDLIEHLGDMYEQEIITSFIPDPPAYAGVRIREYRRLNDPADLLPCLNKFRPDLMHIHYWGDCDWGWYDKVFRAAEQIGCKIIENINTPVTPYVSESISHYIYVSDYVYTTFGGADTKGIVIYPGSNFDMFVRGKTADIPDNCIGMVYRLEPDKLDTRAIDVYIKVAQRRPGTRVLIVGGGTLLDVYKDAVERAGLNSSFVFMGYVPYDGLPSLYEQMSIFVAPVWNESFGQVSSFAMNMGIPVVGYNVGALSEILGSDETLASPGDSNRLADLIIALLDDPQKMAAIGARNQKRAQSLFSVDAMISAYMKLYADLTGSHSLRGQA